MTVARERLPVRGQTVWIDRYRFFRPLPLVFPAIVFLLIPLLIMLDKRGLQNVSEWFCWTGPVVLFVVIPLLDRIVGPENSGPPADAIAQLEKARFYRWTVWAFIPLQIASVIAGAFLFVSTDLTFFAFEGTLSGPAKLGIAISMGIVGGLGINIGHELGHRRDGWERWLAKAALAPTFYGHFPVVHNLGHHVRVATPEDHSSARLGESIWRFLPRTVVGSLRLAWTLEATRMKRLGRPVWHISNEVVQSWLMSLAFWGAALAVLSHRLLPFIVIQAVVGVALLETVNYLEHYGLLRQRTANGRYETCKPEHSWNSDQLVSNFVLLNLQRHSDHHAHPDLRYQSLRSRPDAPQLPYGYALMILLAWVPPIWRKVMDRRVIDHYAGDVSRANVGPRQRTVAA
jgi:alkane 1-monooxygenase